MNRRAFLSLLTVAPFAKKIVPVSEPGTWGAVTRSSQYFAIGGGPRIGKTATLTLEMIRRAWEFPKRQYVVCATPGMKSWFESRVPTELRRRIRVV